MLSAALGLVVERWLFFAEAKHTVMLYYGAETYDRPACATRPGRARSNSPSIDRRTAWNALRSAPASRVVAGILTLSGSIAAL